MTLPQNPPTLKTACFLLSVLFAAVAAAQSQPSKPVLSETFAQPPEGSSVGWRGNLSDFRIQTRETSNVLQLAGNSTRSDTSWLSAPLSLMHGEWEYMIEFGSEPSQTNRADLILMSSSPDLESPFDGYLVKAGDNGSGDVLRLMRVDKGSLIPILSGSLPIGDGGHVWVRVQRHNHGQWSMQSSRDGTEWTDEGSVTDTTFANSAHTGFRFIYTRTRSNDYAIGPITIRRHAPGVVSAQASETTVRIRFDTPMDTHVLPTWQLNGHQTTASIVWDDRRHCRIELAGPLPGGTSDFKMQGLRTEDGLFEDLAVEGVLKVERPAKSGDVLINEYMYYPPDGVPQFVELVNASGEAVNLKGWELRDLSTGNRKITENDLWIPTDSLLVLTPDADALAAFYGFTGAFQMPRFPFLNRGSKDGIVLRNAAGTAIDSLVYQPGSQGDGVSIERVSRTAVSAVPENWQPSTAIPGATPGKTNTARPPGTKPGIMNHHIEGRKRLKIRFRSSIHPPSLENIRSSWPVESISTPAPDSLIVNHAVPFESGQSLQWTLSGIFDAFDRAIQDTIITADFQAISVRLGAAVLMRPDSLVLHFTVPAKAGTQAMLLQEGRPIAVKGFASTYATSHAFLLEEPVQLDGSGSLQIEVRGFIDADGILIADPLISLSKPAGEGLLLSEVMFNPLQERYDNRGEQSQYVEIYNVSPHPQWLHGMHLLGTRASNGRRPTVTFEIPISATLPPNSHGVLTADTARVALSRLVRFFELKDTTRIFRANRSTLGLSTSAGEIVLAGQNGSPIDSMHYSADMHLPSVRDRRGVSLERVSFELPGTDRKNWSSHAGLLGGSPLSENSISVNFTEVTRSKSLSANPIPFSPDGDGREDILSIHVDLQEPGWIVSISIFDRFGRPIRTLVNGERVAASQGFIWNGLDDRGKAIPTGVYIVLLDAWHPEASKRHREKIAIALVLQPIRGAPFK